MWVKTFYNAVSELVTYGVSSEVANALLNAAIRAIELGEETYTKTMPVNSDLIQFEIKPDVNTDQYWIGVIRI